MTVEEALEDLRKIVEDGYGDAELIFIDMASGVSYDASVGNIVVHESSDIDAGTLCDMEEGTIYVPIYGG